MSQSCSEGHCRGASIDKRAFPIANKNQWGKAGGIAVGGPQKIAENCGKIAVFCLGNCSWDLEKFGFPDTGLGKGRQKMKVQTKPKPIRKYDFTHLWSFFTKFW
jgi:hypothetical protein